MPMRLARPVLLAAAVTVALAGCGGGDDETSSSEGTQVPAPTEAPATQTQSPAAQSPATQSPAQTTAPTTGDDATTAPAGYPPRPRPGDCVDIPTADDSRYTVYEAGTAVVTPEGDRLVVGEVAAADGWTARVDDQDDDEVEIDFRRNDEDVLDLEVELDDGRVEVEICADDD